MNRVSLASIADDLSQPDVSVVLVTIRGQNMTQELQWSLQRALNNDLDAYRTLLRDQVLFLLFPYRSYAVGEGSVMVARKIYDAIADVAGQSLGAIRVAIQHPPSVPHAMRSEGMDAFGR